MVPNPKASLGRESLSQTLSHAQSANSSQRCLMLIGRLRIVLLSASGKTNQQIARQLGLTAATVGKWRRRACAKMSRRRKNGAELRRAIRTTERWLFSGVENPG